MIGSFGSDGEGDVALLHTISQSFSDSYAWFSSVPFFKLSCSDSSSSHMSFGCESVEIVWDVVGSSMPGR